MAQQKALKVLELPQPTGGCDYGPILEANFGGIDSRELKVHNFGSTEPRELKVRYDTYIFEELNAEERTAGAIVWTTVIFSAVIGMRFIPDVATTLTMVKAYSVVAEVENSNWLAALRKQAAKSDMRIPDTFNHYMIYFDHVGCLEVIAMSVRIGGDEGSKPVPDR